MCEPVTLTMLAIAATAASAGASVYEGQQQKGEQKKATQQAKASSDAAMTQQEQEVNRANAKQPDTNALQSANDQAAKAGQSGTMLTGPSGVDPSVLALGKNTLLGQ